MVVGVFGQLLPKSAANFRALATCTGAFSDLAKCFRGDTFHRVVPEYACGRAVLVAIAAIARAPADPAPPSSCSFVIQGCSKATGTSIYGPTFREERSAEQHAFLSHVQKGAVSWAEYPIGSQWFVLTGRQSAYLDKNHALFGFVTEGMDVLDKLAAVPVDGDKPRMKITIIDSGDLHGHH
jgi:peptidylprolyl isomerase